jgi:hypothetical protein
MPALRRLLGGNRATQTGKLPNLRAIGKEAILFSPAAAAARDPPISRGSQVIRRYRLYQRPIAPDQPLWLNQSARFELHTGLLIASAA